MRRAEEGAVLVFAVLIMLGLLGLAHGALVVARSELAGSRAAVRHLLVRTGAERGLHAALASEAGTWMDSLGLWDARTTSLGVLGRVEALGTVRRLDSEWWLTEGTGTSDLGVTERTGRLAWSLDPLTRVLALPAIVSLGAATTVVTLTEVDAAAPHVPAPPLEASACDPWIATLAARMADAPWTDTARVAEWVDGPALGQADVDDLLALGSVAVAGVGTPAPEEAFGVCLEDVPWNWGDPMDPARPCGSHLALRTSAGDLRVQGGMGQGVLVVAGDLTLTAGARYFGLLVVSGVLRLEAGAILEGMALAGAGLYVGADAEVRGSACWAVRALSSQRAPLGRFRSPGAAERFGPL